jgi:hypothetical protein
MGVTGPAPKRSDARRRENIVPEPSKSAAGQDIRPIPPNEDWHPAAKAWYGSLWVSGQVVYYEQSDCANAYLAATILSDQYEGDKMSAQMIAQFITLSAGLLTSEASRRRVSVELQRAKPAAPVLEVADYRERFAN